MARPSKQTLISLFTLCTTTGGLTHVVGPGTSALTVRKCIPHSWRSKLSSGFAEEPTPCTTMKLANTIVDIVKSSPKIWYESLLIEARIEIKRQRSWEQELQLPQQEEVEWQERYLAPYKSSRETKLQSFAFKLAHRLIPCGHFLIKMRLREQCTECEDTGTIIHYLYECRHVQQFWQKVIKWFDDFTHISLLNLSSAQFLFGVPKTIGG